MTLTIKKILSFKSAILALSLIVLVCNIFILVTGIIIQLKTENKNSFEPGLQFADLKDDLNGVHEAGFITNKDLSSENNDGQFLMAQYMLAPTALDLNATKHKYNILDCTSKTHVLYALRSLNAAPLKINKYGKILAVKQ
ncbi:MAG: hypothetical protein A2306_08960 [Omnitrophica WOR_2 bacterium RIFOXYB2_FULL_38_16]|nr:MAG: hypothetical protein A2Y06_06370 [Omnitrophica WOR_2 bacterium GWA2_37_7]OGX52526.1 MAG: hypothetical protein A2267_05090 [Omnitrophica WOR_2 bacterium RIFOXYA12_FULL_38_10]OGX60143.1 MAG: hypothetical protein A2306_08960 [Omnitrophica WOR_2 bacterium RIFOXYB2_FULL_38_16]